MRRTAVVMVALGALVLGACGDDDDGGGSVDISEEERPYVDAMIASAQDEEEFAMSPEQAECVAPRWIDAIGVERLQEAGIEPEDIGSGGSAEISELGLNDEEGGALYDAFGACDVDVHALFIESLAEDSELSEEDRDCLAEQFDDQLLRRIMVATLTQGDDAIEQDEELMGELLGVFSECPGAAG